MKLWKLKNDAYQVLLDGLKWKLNRVEEAARRQRRRDLQLTHVYCRVIRQTTGHHNANRSGFLLVVGIVFAHVVVFFVGIREWFLDRRH